MTIKGSCHCGDTRFEVDVVPDGVTRCTCSFCSKRGALWLYATPEQFRVTGPSKSDAIYQWQTRTVKHHFCGNCGCTTFSVTPDWSRGTPDFDNMRIGINLRLVDDIDLDAVPVTVLDGKNLW